MKAFRRFRDSGKTAISRARDRMRTALVVAEIAIAVVLLVGTGLLVRGAEKLRQVPLGFNAHDTITARVTLPAVRYRDDQMVADAYRRILEPLRGTRGIRHAGAATNIPLVGGNADAATVAEGKPVMSHHWIDGRRTLRVRDMESAVIDASASRRADPRRWAMIARIKPDEVFGPQATEDTNGH